MATRDPEVVIGTGCSTAAEGGMAGERAARRAIAKFESRGGKTPLFGLLFCSGSKYRDTVEDLVTAADNEFRAQNEKIDWIGCTTAGEIFRGEVQTGSCIALVLSAQDFDVSVGIGEEAYRTGGAGRRAAREAVEGIDLSKAGSQPELSQFLLAFLSGPVWESDGVEARAGREMFDELDDSIPVMGGAAGDDLQLCGTHQFANGTVYNDAVVTAAISTRLQTGFSWGDGFESTGKQAKVTAASGGRIETMDGKPALQRYADLLEIDPHELWKAKGDNREEKNMPADTLAERITIQEDPYADPFIAKANMFPFGVQNGDGARTVHGPRNTDGESIAVAPQIEPGTEVDILEYNEEKFGQAERGTLDAAASNVNNPKLLFVAESPSRVSALGETAIEEKFAAVQDERSNVTVFGFNSMGELGTNPGQRPHESCHAITVGCLGEN